MTYETILVPQFFSPQNNDAFNYYNSIMQENNKTRVLPYLLSNNKEIFRLDTMKTNSPNTFPLIKERYILPEVIKCPLGDSSEISLAAEWADKFIKNEISNADLEPIKILSKIKGHLKNYVCLDERDYSLLSLWIFGTYYYSLFNEFPYLLVKGENREADLTLTKVLHELCFNAKYGVYQSADLLAKDMSRIGGTFIVEDPSHMLNQPLLRTIISEGYSSVSHSYPFKSKKNPTVCCSLYSPKIFLNIPKYQKLIEGKFVRVSPLAQKAPELYDRENLKPFRDTASMCCLSALLNFKEVHEEYKLVPLKHAPEDINRPIIALAIIAGGQYELAEMTDT